ncbi:BRCA1-associated RING domain protein 1-like isoform X1 [Athalia rosae]|uniref:BRCA1-associated RING domain protein 1-like isoform X1 n=1 Tax=Athalia rosae TaxID=37344 RepID=UPI002034878D|nr:BRCA1-associated RING domain protein 1-like isoform X1 [Athalia rosae]XP_048507119.1 BRCA1-associated RING domain protein 1-like isoform X1 [Athalia rosae]
MGTNTAMTSSTNEWIRTNVALKNFMEDFLCCKCKNTAQNPIRYQNCSHIFCSACVRGAKLICWKCKTSVKRNEVYSDIIAAGIITYGETIAQIINQKESPSKNDRQQSSNVSIQEHDVSLRTRNIPKGDINKPNMKGETRLHTACIKANTDMVRTLLEAGANPNTKDHSNWLPLHESVSFHHYEICELLLEAGALPNTPGHFNRTALHEAVMEDDSKLIELLLQHNSDLSARDCFGKTPLDYAVSDEVRRLLTDYKPAKNLLEKSIASSLNITCNNKSFTWNGINVFGSNLSSENRSLLIQVANKHRLKIVKDFKPTVMLVVVEVNNQNTTPLSNDILLAILHGKWIVSTQWLRHSMELEDMSVEDLEQFEVQGTTGMPFSGIPTRARTNSQKQNPKLFNGCYFFFQMNGQFLYSVGRLGFTIADLAHLITEGEGEVLKREPDPELIQSHREIPFHVGGDLKHPLHKCSHYIIYAPGKGEPAIKYNMDHIKSLPLIWLITCIEHFELLDPAFIGITQ